MVRMRLASATAELLNHYKRLISSFTPYSPLVGGKDVLDAEYARGAWDCLSNIEEQPRISIVSGYCQHYKSGGSILEIGCGTGTLRGNLLVNDGFFLGIDISSVAIERAAKYQDERTRFVCADADLYMPTMMFDIVIFNECLEYFGDPLATVRRYESFLKEDALFIVSMFRGIETARTKHIWRMLDATYEVKTRAQVATQRGYSWLIKVYSIGRTSETALA